MTVSHFRRIRSEPHFRWRGGEITRVEAFSDAVFAFAVTLLVVSLEVPKTWHELAIAMKGFGAFAVCFTFLVMVWNEHRRFFRRYGLEDPYAIFLNSALLFVSLFYVYPLKFLFTTLLAQITNGATVAPELAGKSLIQPGEVAAMMITYSLGFASVYLIFSLMYVHAYRLRAELELNEIEVFTTRRSLQHNTVLMAFGVAVAILAFLLGRNAGFAGWVYWLVSVYFTIAETMFAKRERLILEKMERERHALAEHAAAATETFA